MQDSALETIVLRDIYISLKTSLYVFIIFKISLTGLFLQSSKILSKREKIHKKHVQKSSQIFSWVLIQLDI